MILIIYLIGYIACYLLNKYNQKRRFGKWTKGDRSFALKLSTSSWIGFVVCIFYVELDNNENEKANWWKLNYNYLYRANIIFIHLVVIAV